MGKKDSKEHKEAKDESKDHSSDKNNQQKSTKKKTNLWKDLKITLFTSAIYICIIAYLLNLLKEQKDPVSSHTDCSDYFREGVRKDGIYEIKPDPNRSLRLNVYCNMTAGGYTVILRRDENLPQAEFGVGIRQYQLGFGDLNGEHFIGLDNIHMLTHIKQRELMLIFNSTVYRINKFKVLNDFYHYKIVLDDELNKLKNGASLLRINNTMFSTIDVDYDLAQNGNCTSGWKAGWWFTDCFDRSFCVTCKILHTGNTVLRYNPAIMLIK